MYLQFVQKAISNAHLMLVHNKHLQTNKKSIPTSLGHSQKGGTGDSMKLSLKVASL